MLNNETKHRIDTARDILVGKVPDPKSQVEQITIALIYKFMDDMDRQSVAWGGEASFFSGEFAPYSWLELFAPRLSAEGIVTLYSDALTKMSENPNLQPLFRQIFKNAYLPYRDPSTLRSFLKEINGFNYDDSENLGDAFEYLLSVLGSQGDAGQFRTPRHIIDFIVAVVDPQKHERILDPACGTGGFLISAYKHIMSRQTSEVFKTSEVLTIEDKTRLMENIVGYDISPDMVRLSLVNLYLHKFPNPKIFEYDTLTTESRWADMFDVIMANPPFMSPKGGIKPHDRFQVQANRSEVLFVDYIAEHLSPRGRAGIIVPEGIIFQTGKAYMALRKMLVDNYLWAVVSLPAGIFQPYSGVKTSILFLDKQLARQRDSILFVKIKAEGFDLGAQRRVSDKDDLPAALALLQEYRAVGQASCLSTVDSLDRQVDSLDRQDACPTLLQEYRAVGQASCLSTVDRQDACLQWTGKMPVYSGQARCLSTVDRQDACPTVLPPSQTLSVPKSTLASKGDFNLSMERYWVNEQARSTAYEWVALGDERHFKIESGGTPDTGNPEYWNGNINWITLVDLPSHNLVTEIYDTQRKITELGLKNSSAKIIPKDSVVVSSRATIGRVGITKIELATNQGFRCIIIKDTNQVLPKFVAFMVTSLVPQMEANANGGTFKEISRTNFSKLQIPLPPLEVQRDIVAEIERYQAIIDGARQVITVFEGKIKGKISAITQG